METKEIHTTFDKYVANNDVIRKTEKYMKFITEITTMIKCRYHIKGSITTERGTVDEPFGYNVHVGSSIYFRVGSEGIHFDNDKHSYREPSETLIKDIVDKCNIYYTRNDVITGI